MNSPAETPAGRNERPYLQTPRPEMPYPQMLDTGALYLALAESDGLDGFLQELTERAAHVVRPGACSVTLHRADRLRTVAASEGLVSGLDQIQYEVDTGPCVTAARESTEQHAPDMGAEQRWVPFPVEARGRGVRSMLALPLTLNHGVHGALNFYAGHRDAFVDRRESARRLAAQASGAVAVALRIEHEREIGLDLRAAMLSRGVIDQAIGIVMTQRRCDADTALGLLRRCSQDENVKLRELCVRLVTRVGGVPPRRGEFTERLPG
ncbi:GAF and ANTAR domain-containing protein [Streptomyces kunmingensis]|uniref:GAF and ANTAR domain-containing protein n=1 Tax=Streptomyces kunmingensis TaxID=68225 RepID=A0ABU6C4C1_9ACTN|nr:GAF and ANTAR domain-containing protein [Streptomyces kunmingensis]MEB3959579.1 GAF and ANTAR domain-containing protein [Streptomyces kunmingensis]